jgi:ABC-type transporter Mla subunit MlaD
MDQMTLLYVMTAFVIISAIALCIQAGFLFGMYKTAKTMEEKVVPLVPKVNALLDTAKTTVEQSKKQIVDITTKANDILDSAKRQLAQVEGVVTDASSRAKVQMERVEMVLDDTMSRAHETVATVHNGVMRPLREVNGIAVGIKTALAHLARGGRPSVAQATSDEEMFI